MSKKKPYKLGKWKGMTKYICQECPYETLDEDDMQKHIQERHMMKAREPVKVPIFDRFGNLITEKEV